MKRVRSIVPAQWWARLLPFTLAFVALRVLEATGRAPAWARWWGDDLLCLPLVLGGVLILHRIRAGSGSWTLPASHGVLVLGIYAVVFELLLPRLGRGTADPLDVLAYGVGGLVFQLVLNVPAGVRGRESRIPA